MYFPNIYLFLTLKSCENQVEHIMWPPGDKCIFLRIRLDRDHVIYFPYQLLTKKEMSQRITQRNDSHSKSQDESQGDSEMESYDIIT